MSPELIADQIANSKLILDLLVGRKVISTSFDTNSLSIEVPEGTIRICTVLRYEPDSTCQSKVSFQRLTALFIPNDPIKVQLDSVKPIVFAENSIMPESEHEELFKSDS